MTETADLVIRNGTVVDGSGRKPFRADVAITGDVITHVGHREITAVEEIDADGHFVTPGFVDIHTHYDGQAIWEETLSPSSNHGVTTVVIGNCGVGFAPCRNVDRENLIRLMEGVEDIPGVVMTEGLTWEWETFPEYLAALERRRHDVNIAFFLPHSPLRVYVMGERAAAGETATDGDLKVMSGIVEEAMREGALGVGSSRTIFHRSSSGELIPTFDADMAELDAIAGAIARSGGGVLQVASDFKEFSQVKHEFDLLKEVARKHNLTLTIPVAENHTLPEVHREIMRHINEANDAGVHVKAQVMPRGVGLLFGLELSAHPFALSPSYKAIEHLPIDERVAVMKDPAFKRKLLEEPVPDTKTALHKFIRGFGGMFEIGEGFNYEPDFSESIQARASSRGESPLSLAYDILVEKKSSAALYMPFANYAHGNLDSVGELIANRDVVMGLGDGGAHYGIICDASYSTFLLSYWSRDRVRGQKIALEKAVSMLSRETAAMVGLEDRGLIAPGYRADLNVIDFDGLRLRNPQIVFDLPSGGRRLIQKSEGYRATIVNGKVIYREGVATGARTGELVRGRRKGPVLR